MSLSHRRFAFLAGLGLLVLGLLAGVLATLWLRPMPSAPLVVADRVVPRQVSARGDSVEEAVLPDLGALNQRFRQVAEVARDAVVFVEVESRGSSLDWLRRFGGATPDGIQVPYQQSIGSGVLISSDGYVLTNHHVVADAGHVTVTLSDRRQFEAEIVGIDRATDLAVLRVEGEKLPSIVVGDSDGLFVGEWVLAVGNPFRLTSTVTAGIVSALGRQVDIIDDALRVEDFIQTDAAINPGNSGGALVNLKGELVGISTAIATEGGSYEGYGFAVPSNLALRVATDLISDGHVQRGFMGVELADVSPRLAQRLGLTRVGGVFLQRVPTTGAAYQAGLRAGDVVTHVGSRTVDAPNELQSAILRYRPGDEVAISILREGQEKRFTVALASPDDPVYTAWLDRDEPETRYEQQPSERDAEVVVPQGWGVALRDPDGREREAFHVDYGAYVSHIERGSVADFAGLPRDVVLVAIEDTDVTNAEEAAVVLETLSGDDPVLLRVQRRDGVAAFYELLPPTR